MPSDNIGFLFAAFAVCWVAFFVYAFVFVKRQRRIESQMAELRSILEQRGQGSASD